MLMGNHIFRNWGQLVFTTTPPLGKWRKPTYRYWSRQFHCGHPTCVDVYSHWWNSFVCTCHSTQFIWHRSIHSIKSTCHWGIPSASFRARWRVYWQREFSSVEPSIKKMWKTDNTLQDQTWWALIIHWWSKNGLVESVPLSSLSIGTISNVQSLTVKINIEGLLNIKVYLLGAFLLSLDVQKTGQLTYNASTEEVKAALEKLCNVQEVYITKSMHCSPDLLIGCMQPDGYIWLVTFVSLNNLGAQHHRHNLKLSSSASHKLSVDGSYLFECSDVSRATCSIRGSAVANIGTTQEIQRITVASSPFSVTIGGETSYVIINSGDSILLPFSSCRGDLPAVIVSDSAVTVSKITKGNSQFVVGRASYSTVISGLTSVYDCHLGWCPAVWRTQLVSQYSCLLSLIVIMYIVLDQLRSPMLL